MVEFVDSEDVTENGFGSSSFFTSGMEGAGVALNEKGFVESEPNENGFGGSSFFSFLVLSCPCVAWN